MLGFLFRGFNGPWREWFTREWTLHVQLILHTLEIYSLEMRNDILARNVHFFLKW